MDQTAALHQQAYEQIQRVMSFATEEILEEYTISMETEV